MSEVPEVSDTALRGVSEHTALPVITSAFVDDPVERWLYPDEAYERDFPRFAQALGGKAFDSHTAWTTTDANTVALWLPPGVTPDGQSVIDVLTSTVDVAKHDDMFSALQQMDDAHPHVPHWYLVWLAVDRRAQGRGLGAQLLSRCLAMVDASHQAAYLETPNPRTVPFYQRHGFSNVGHTHGGSCPPITFMHRSAR